MLQHSYGPGVDESIMQWTSAGVQYDLVVSLASSFITSVPRDWLLRNDHFVSKRRLTRSTQLMSSSLSASLGYRLPSAKMRPVNDVLSVVCLSICLSVCLCRVRFDGLVCLSICLPVCLSVCLLDVIMCCAKTAEPVEMVFGMWTRMDLRNCVL